MSDKTFYTLISLFEELRGEHVVVRPYRESDTEAVFEARMESREHLLPWMPFAQGDWTLEAQRDLLIRWMAAWLRREQLFTGFWHAVTGRYLGSSGLHVHSWETGYFEIGYWVRASETGKGYVTEAVKLQTEYAFTHLHANRVEICCDERNERSAAVARRSGFVQEGRLRNEQFDVTGKLRNTLIFALTPEDRTTVK